MMNKSTQELENSKFVNIATKANVDTNNKRIFQCINPKCVRHIRTYTANAESNHYVEVCISDQTEKWINTPNPKGYGKNIDVPVNPKCPECHSEKYLRFLEDTYIDEAEKLNYAKASLVEFLEDGTTDIHTIEPDEGFKEGYTYWEKPKVTVEEERKINKATAQNIYNLSHPEPQDPKVNEKLKEKFGVLVHQDLSKQQVAKYYKNMNYRSSMMRQAKYKSEKWYDHSYELERLKLVVLTGNLTGGIISIPREYKDKNTETMTIEKILLNEIAPKEEFPAWDKIKKENEKIEQQKLKIEVALSKLRDTLSF